MTSALTNKPTSLLPQSPFALQKEKRLNLLLGAAHLIYILKAYSCPRENVPQIHYKSSQEIISVSSEEMRPTNKLRKKRVILKLKIAVHIVTTAMQRMAQKYT
jgi:hypothetical protein